MNPDNEPARAFIAELEGRAQRHEVGFEGGQVTWRRFGQGAPLVLLHGGHGSWLHWARNIAALTMRHAVWVPDLPGYGASSAPVRPTLDSLVDTTCRTLDALIGAGTPIGLAGFSFGSLVAAHLAVRRGCVTRLALLGPAGHGGPRRPRGELRSWREAHERQDKAALREVMRHNLLMHMLYDAGAANDLAVAIHTAACLRTRFRSKPISRSGGLDDCLACYAGPVLLVWGEHDVTADPQQAVLALGRGRADRHTRIVPEAGHWVQFECSDAANTLLLEWFDETGHRLQLEE
jgi:pimeloyl-ACP methyl ester carboxylesterase